MASDSRSNSPINTGGDNVANANVMVNNVEDSTNENTNASRERQTTRTHMWMGGASGDSRSQLNQTQNRSSRGGEERNCSSLNEEEEEELELKYGAQHVIKLFIPVSLCMVVVVATVSSITRYTKTDIYLLYTPFHEESDRWQDRVQDAFLNAIILLSVVVVLTIVLIVLYLRRCYLIIKGWLGMSSLLLLSLFTSLYLMELLGRYNIGMDWISLFIIVWNFGVVGMICIHWKGPLRLQQAYLIFISALMSLIFIKYIPEYTLWVVLAVISIWANIMYSTLSDNEGEVDAPARMSGRQLNSDGGANSGENQENNPPPPKRKRKRNYAAVAENGHTVDGQAAGFSSQWEQDADERVRRRRERVREHVAENPVPEAREASHSAESQLVIDEEERGVKLGLGDFIFYSVLVGKASSYGDWNTTFACFIAILIGLCLTLIMLAIFKKALPALPISIGFGLMFYFSTSILVVPFTEELTINQVFI